MARDDTGQFQSNDRFREVMSTLIGVRWESVWEAVPVAIEGSDPEGVHDVRVASRRLRAAMDVAVDSFPSSWFKPLHRVAKDITSELGEVRDRDVLLEFLERERDAASLEERPGIERLIARVTAERDAARTKMLDYLEDLVARGFAEQARKRFGPMNPNSPDTELNSS